MFASLPPGIIMVLGACVVPFIPHVSRQIWMLVMIALSAWGLTTGAGIHTIWHVMGYDLILYRADALTMPFAIIFHLAAALNVIYSWHDQKWQEHTASLSYAGAAIAAVHAGDLITLFIWWEATAVTSVFLILAAGTPTARRAAMRYLIFQVLSGVLLLAGAAIYAANSGSIAFVAMTLGDTATWLIF
ncbi:MAG: proton-conducting transporter membrane subunit, partial [Candidatus Puniceispirillum sp.]